MEESLKTIPGPVEYRTLNDGELSILWSRKGDLFARDLLMLRKWSRGDNKKGMQLLSLYEKFFYNICLRFGVSRDEEILEIFQDVVLGLLERLEKLPGLIEKSFAGYLAWRTRSAIQRFRGRRPSESIPLIEVACRGETARIEDWEIIEKCWNRLPPKEHRIFELRFIQEMNLEEIAAALGNTANAVGQRIFSLSRKMRECLQKMQKG